MVSKANAWSHSVASAARVIDDSEPSETNVLRQKYWTAFNHKLESVGGPVSGKRSLGFDRGQVCRIVIGSGRTLTLYDGAMRRLPG